MVQSELFSNFTSSCVDSLISLKCHCAAYYTCSLAKFINVLLDFCRMAEAAEDVLEWQVKQLNKVLCLWLSGRLQDKRQG